MSVDSFGVRKSRRSGPFPEVVGPSLRLPSSSAPGRGVLHASHQGVLILEGRRELSWNPGLDGVPGTPVHFI